MMKRKRQRNETWLGASLDSRVQAKRRAWGLSSLGPSVLPPDKPLSLLRHRSIILSNGLQGARLPGRSRLTNKEIVLIMWGTGCYGNGHYMIWRSGIAFDKNREPAVANQGAGGCTQYGGGGKCKCTDTNSNVPLNAIALGRKKKRRKSLFKLILTKLWDTSSKSSIWGTSLAVQWLRLYDSNTGMQVWCLVREPRSHMPQSVAPKLKYKKNWEFK